MSESQNSSFYMVQDLLDFIRKRRNTFGGFCFRSFCLWLCTLLFIVFSVGNLGCRSRSSRVVQQQRAIEKRKEEKRKQQQAIYQKTLDHHQSMQGEDGKRRLEEAKKHRKQLDKQQGKSTSWFKRLFIKDQGGCGPRK